ncbi:hypothetical protein CG015_01715 [Vibrio anguillarum]|nr:hypothetical protein CG015_01715 [Vibrio anguillarum]
MLRPVKSRMLEVAVRTMIEQLKRQYHRAKTITLIMDNYIIHKSKKTRSGLKQNPKFVLLFSRYTRLG